jgi:hypothetical protein
VFPSYTSPTAGVTFFEKAALGSDQMGNFDAIVVQLPGNMILLAIESPICLRILNYNQRIYKTKQRGAAVLKTNILSF